MTLNKKYSKANVLVVSGNDGDEEEIRADAISKDTNDIPVINNHLTLNGRPFSAVHPDLLTPYFDEAEERFDEFGFRKKENNDEDPTAELPLLETSQHRMKWLAHIQFTNESVKDLTWQHVNINLIKNTPKYDELLRTGGIPHSLRAFLWPRLAGVAEKQKKFGCNYESIVKKSLMDTSAVVDLQIDKDLLRTLPNNYCFAKMNSLATVALKNILKAISFIFPDVGYCQGMGMVVGSLLLVCSEQDTFWIMCILIEV